MSDPVLSLSLLAASQVGVATAANGSSGSSACCWVRRWSALITGR
ncbi:MAG TPA: hypothetical protein VE476_16750 [Propionibacteriaceae bacterium]|nr:hypothetical protein [Propionibacteriaceae bacterium]